MASFVDILANFQGQDNVTPVAQQINQNLESMMGNANAQGGGLMNTMSRLGGIFQGLNGLVMGVFGAYGLSTFKNMTYGMATAREEVKGLYESVAGSTKDANSEAAQLWEYMDELTNQGYVQLDDLTQAMNVFGMSTASGVEGMKIAVDMVNDIGNRAIQMGYDSNRQQLLMQSVAQGLNGNMRMLNVAFGITKQKLIDMGWSGQANDIQGYIDAIDRYLNENVKMDDLLNSTQGRVVALQKRFRIAGRNLGNYMLPPINAIMSGFTQLNAQSNDLLASLIIIGTGAMSGFASILPTLAPLIQVYQFMGETFGKGNNIISTGNGLIIKSTSNVKSLTNALKGVIRATKEWIAVPVINWLEEVALNHSVWIRKPINSFLDKVHLNLGKVNKRLMEFAIRTKETILAPFTRALNRLRNSLYSVTNRLAGFILQYGKASKIKVAEKLLNKGLDPRNYANLDATTWFKVRNSINERNRKTSANDANIKRLTEETKAIWNQSKAMSVHTLQIQANTLAKDESIIASEGKSVANTEEAVTEDLSTFAKIRNTIATWANTAGEEAGLWAKIKAIAINLKKVAVDKIVAVWNNIIAITQLEILWPLLLIIAAIVALIAVIDQIGKTLGWWDNWKEMLNAIVSGLNRLWQAFINNPNVQGFIKDIQWIFGKLGETISWAAWQVLQFFGWEDTGEEVDIVRMIIDTFGALADMLGKVVNAVKWFFTVTGPIWRAIFTVISIPVRLIIGLLKGIVCIIMGCSPGIIPAIQSLRDIFMSIFPYIAMALGRPIRIIIGLFTGLFKNINIVDKIRTLGTRFYTVARNIGLMLWNGLNSIVGSIPRRVWNTFMTMITNLTRIPQMVFNKGKEFGQSIYDGMDSAVSGLTGGAIHLPGANTGKAKQNAKTIGNATKNYNNSRNVRGGHVINIGHGAIQLDARNLTTKESKQIMINALEGLTTYETVHTKNAAGGNKKK